MSRLHLSRPCQAFFCFLENARGKFNLTFLLLLGACGPTDSTFEIVQPGLFSAPGAQPNAWADYDNDGWTDLYVASYLNTVPEADDYLYKSIAGAFEIVTSVEILEKGASHGVQWADFDADGDLDLALANNNAEGSHYLYRSLLPAADAQRSVQAMVADSSGRHTLPGAEVRIYAAGTDRLLGTRLVDTGGGYCSQNVMPVHVGFPANVDRVRVEVTVMRLDGRKQTVMENVDPNGLPHRIQIVRVPR